ncbi:MAG: alpha/beta hydrolase [Oscillospiraceae bacterium]|nr:alpha/beta hydrolase [Oscillospiraceae bacterium]
MKRCVPLEAAAEAVCDQNSIPPLIFQLPSEQGRKVLEKTQDSPVYLYPADISVSEADTVNWGTIPVYFIRPKDKVPRHVIFYIHGAGWVFGSFHTHEKLVRELAARTDSLVVFPEYSRSPEAKYPTAIEQCYFVLSHLREITGDLCPALCQDTLTVAGDSVGGNMSIAMTFMAKQRKGSKIQKQLLYYPVTNACFDTPSYCRFATNYYLYRAGMQWFWDQYTACEADRRQITASPLQAGTDFLRGLPKTMIINGQADVLRSEGESFGKKLRCAGVEVTTLCLPGIIHDFVMLNSLDQTNACRRAMDASIRWINQNNQQLCIPHFLPAYNVSNQEGTL